MGGGKIINYRYNFLQFDRIRLARINIDKKWRRQDISASKNADSFEVLACRPLKYNLPVAYVEGFTFLKRTAAREYRYSKKVSAIVYSPTAYTYDETLKHLLVKGHKNSALLCEIQHGGDYGIVDWRTFRIARQVDDYMYTWGWKLKSNTEINWKPMPAAKLLNSKLRSVKTGKDILYIGYTWPKYVYDSGIEIYFSKKLREDEKAFLLRLDDKVKRQMLIRTYPEDFGVVSSDL